MSTPTWDRVSGSSGYRTVFNPDHPRAWSTGYVYIHVLVAEWKLGRFLRRGEVVHHINGDRKNNSPENIEVLSSLSAHAVKHGGEKTLLSLVNVSCFHCGKKFQRKKSRSPEAVGRTRAFCSPQCRGKAYGYKKTGLIKHGTSSGYKYHKCRCDLCRDYNRRAARRQRSATVA